MLVDFFKDLFSSPSPCQLAETLNSIHCLIIDDMNRQLCKAFTDMEVHEALKQMAPLKAPELNGMPPLFYQNIWGSIGKDITQDVLYFLNSTSLPHHLNHTFITLIPKVKNPELASQFHPISLCNVLYKIFSKVLANRLKNVLLQIITKHQSAFTKNRLISDNILVAFESLHGMRNHKKGKDGFMALKLDMSKGYDRVEWPFLESIMRKSGFKNSWIRLLIMCVTTVSYSVLLMENLKVLSDLQGVFDREILFHPFYSYYALKVFMV